MSGYGVMVRHLALSLAAGAWDRPALEDRLSRLFGEGPPTPRMLAARLLFHYPEGRTPPLDGLIDRLHADDLLYRHWRRVSEEVGRHILLDPPVMQTWVDGPLTFPLPLLATRKDLRLWLGVHDRELDWFADTQGRQRVVDEPRLHHYRYRWIPKASGESRLIEIPKARLKVIQRQILHELLDRVPPHPCAHGFRRHRSTLSYVQPHLGRAAVLRMDLKDFFHSVSAARVEALFERLGYPAAVARLLQGLCTHASSPTLAGEDFERQPWERRRRLQVKHLPQGAPTSPALANLCAWRLDCRLEGLAQHFGLNYSRYADDMAFSGDRALVRLAPFLQSMIGAIALEEGFRINHRKTRLNTRARRQHLAGVVVNERPNLSRGEYDALRAELCNCVRFGPEGQNRRGVADYRAHLAGRVAYATWLNPARREKLYGLLRQIRWPD